MKVFDGNEKINFVDENNIFVGFDLGQSCCEYADWFISQNKENTIPDDKYEYIERERINDLVLLSYTFDKLFFEEVDCGDHLDAGAMVRFRLVADNKPDLYLHIFNSHNGYYSHGFEMKDNGRIIKSDSV